MDRVRLESAAAEYHHLRGLFAIPLSVVFVLAALGNESWGPLRHSWVFVVCLGLLGLACLPVKRFYDENYGRVALSGRQQMRAAVATVAVVPVMWGGATLARGSADWSLDLPVNPIPAAFAVAMLVFYAATVGVKAHHLIVFGALLAAGLLPVWSGEDPSNVGLVMCGIAVLASGILDHRLLVRAMGSPRGLLTEEDDAGA